VINDKFKSRFVELLEQINAFPRQPRGEYSAPPFAAANYEGWGASALALVRAVFGQDSSYHKSLNSLVSSCNGLEWQVEAMKGVFVSAKEAFDGGYVFNIDAEISGEVFADFVSAAKRALSEGYTEVAAVLACAALEDTLKRYAILNGLNVESNSMQDTVNALKSKGLVKGAQKSLLDPMPKIRDYAMHAKWDKIAPPDVSSVIGYVEQFLLTHFSGR
jgi:hypothetical protein